MNDRTFSDFITSYSDSCALVVEPISEGAGERDYERLQELLADFFFQRPGASRDKAAALIGHKVAALTKEHWDGSIELARFERDRDTAPCDSDRYHEKRDSAA